MILKKICFYALISLMLSVGSLSAQKTDMVVQTGHTLSVNDIAFHPGGKYLATGSYDRTVRLWDVETGALLRILSNDDEVYSVDFLPDGSGIMAAGTRIRSGSAIKVWDLETGELLQTLPKTPMTTDLSLSNTRMPLLLTTHPEGFGTWTTTGNVLTLASFVDGEKDLVYSSTAFSRDDSIFAIAMESDALAFVYLFRTTTAEAVQTFEVENEVGKIVFTEDASTIFVEYIQNDGISVIGAGDISSGKSLKKWQGYDPVYHPNGKEILFSNGADSLFVLDVITLKVKRSWKIENIELSNIAISPDGKVVAGTGDNGKIFLWAYETGKLQKEIRSVPASSGIAFSPLGDKLAFSAEPGHVRIWDLPSGDINNLKLHDAGVNLVEISPDGRLMATAAYDSMVNILSLETGEMLFQVPLPFRNANSINFNSTGLFLEIASETVLLTVDIEKETFESTPLEYPLTRIEYSPEDKYVIAAAGEVVIIYDVGSHEQKQQYFFNGTVSAVSITADNQFIAIGGYSDTLYWMNIEGSDKTRKWDIGDDPVLSLAVSADGNILISGHESGVLKIWNPHKAKLLNTIRAHLNGIDAIRFNATGTMFASGSLDGELILWSAENFEKIAGLYAFPSGEWAVVDEAGRYDASNAGEIQFLHFRVGLETIELHQLKERYFEPGLLQKKLGYSLEPLRQVDQLSNIHLYPYCRVSLKDSLEPSIRIQLTERGGGIGKISLFINDREVEEDLRKALGINTQKSIDTIISLRDYARFGLPNSWNQAGIKVWNKEGYLSSLTETIEWFNGNESSYGDVKKPRMFAIIIGTSDYAGIEMDLKFASKDALSMATALKSGAGEFLGQENVKIQLLSTEIDAKVRPLKRNIRTAFENVSSEATSSDILFVFFSGHGVNRGGDDDQFYYLTSELESSNLEDPAVREQFAISSQEMTNWMKSIPAMKQVLILDACASGKLLKDIVAEKTGSFRKVRALQQMKDRTGMFILAGSAENRVSYEASEYGQSLLTYSLLQGMRGPALKEREFLDVDEWFRYAADHVPELAKNIGGLQRPEIAAPAGNSFIIAQVRDPGAIPLASKRPVFARASFQQEDFPYTDDVHIGSAFDIALMEWSLKTGFANAVAVDAMPYAGTYYISGRYKIEGENVTLTGGVVFLNESGKHEPTEVKFQLQGKANDPKSLVNEILMALTPMWK